MARTRRTLRVFRAKVASSAECFVAGMPAAAQQTRVYADYLATIRDTASADIDYAAVSIVGPRNHVDKIVAKLSLLP